MLGYLKYLFISALKNSEDKNIYLLIKKILGYYPADLLFYKLALTHKSSQLNNIQCHEKNNERLEYLGDAVLDAVIADFLFHRYKNKDEGFLTKMRSKMVNRNFLGNLAKKLELDEFVHFNNKPSVQNKNICGNAFEALIGAVFLDKGYKKTKKIIIHNIIGKFIDLEELIDTEYNYKSVLIEWGQKYKKEITFTTEEESLTPPCFFSSAMIDGIIFGEGKGGCKKEAEQNAAGQALINIKE